METREEADKAVWTATQTGRDGGCDDVITVVVGGGGGTSLPLNKWRAGNSQINLFGISSSSPPSRFWVHLIIGVKIIGGSAGDKDESVLSENGSV